MNTMINLIIPEIPKLIIIKIIIKINFFSRKYFINLHINSIISVFHFPYKDYLKNLINFYSTNSSFSNHFTVFQ